MLLIDLIWCSSLDTPLGTEFLTFTTADTGICYHIPLFPDYSISKAVCLTKYRIHAQIKIFYLTLINTEYNTYTSGITRIDICQIRLLLKDGITPFLLFFLAHRICLSRQSYHLFIFCIAKDLNPSIFQKALSQVGPYDAQLKELGKVDVETAVRELTTTDVRNATDIFREIAEATDFVDGRVSIEVDPRLAHDTENTEKQAVELWEKVNRPNAMIKIPATLEGLPAITATLAKGISVNVTLIFSLERYEQVIDAYIEGIAQAAANGHDLKHIGSVASFFVSRVDTAVDKLLEANGSDEAKALEGKAAVANARLAYELFEKKFAADPRWADLAAKGAKVQRPLWASTGTKNAAYSDCKYVDELVAKHIVNTMPEKTLNALADHGNGAPSIEGTYEESHAVIDKLAELGINLKDVTDRLEADGVAAFIKSWDSVLADVQSGIDRVNA